MECTLKMCNKLLYHYKDVSNQSQHMHNGLEDAILKYLLLCFSTNTVIGELTKCLMGSRFLHTKLHD